MGDERTDTEKVGMFVDGPYDTDVTLFRITPFGTGMGKDGPVTEDPLRLGGPFPVVPGHKLKAATNDWTFSPFLNLWEDTPYEDPGAWRRRYEKEKAEQNISQQVYNTTVGGKSMNGLGTYYGTFIENMEAHLAFSPETRDKTEDPLKGVSNFLTNPGKKGSGSGYLDICFNKYPEYMENPAFDQLEARRQMREEFEAAVVGEKSVPGGHVSEYFDPNPFFDTKDPDGQTETYDYDRIPNASAGLEDKVPFIPSNFTKKINGNKDVMSPFEKFPLYDPSSPYETPIANVVRKNITDSDKAPWRAQFGNRSRQTRSILNQNINFRINSTNFHLW